MNNNFIRISILIAVVAAVTFGSYYFREDAGVGFVGSVGSMLGLGLTVIVATEVKKIREQLSNRALLGSSVQKLQFAKHRLLQAVGNGEISNILELMGEFKALGTQILLQLEGVEGVRLEDIDFERVTEVDRRQVISRARGVIAPISEWVVQLELHLEEVDWRTGYDR